MLLKGKLNLAPIENPQSVIDIGTGTGIWAIEFGRKILTSNGFWLRNLLGQPSCSLASSC